jgi:pimeloyl-ACP methyl ester carboxylesterase
VAAFLIIGAARDASARRAPGRSLATRSDPISGLIDIGGYRLSIRCSGAGSPAVVLETGLSGPGRDWDRVQPRLCRSALTCSYDRAGVGASDPRPQSHVTSSDLAQELNALLERGGVAPPYVLVAHSIGGFTAGVYTRRYPEKIAALVLVDTTLETWPSLSDNLPEGNSTLALRTSAEQVRAAGSLRRRPLIVLRHGRPVEGFTARQELLFARGQARLARLSSRSRQIVALRSGHDIPTTQPLLVAAAVQSVLRAYRRNANMVACPSSVTRLGGRCLGRK